ncbi:MAG: hypothetical protein V3W34_16850, partial [Phycisphaerae bacterium]
MMKVTKLATVGMIVSMVAAATPAYATGTEACCDTITGDCFDDNTGTGKECADFPNSTLIPGMCGKACACPATCGTFAAPNNANGSTFNITFTGSAPSGANTVFTYEVCEKSGAALSHWVLGLPDLCCNTPGKIVSVGGPGMSSPTCSQDPTTQVTGIKFDETAGLVPDCGTACAGADGDPCVPAPGTCMGGVCVAVYEIVIQGAKTSTTCDKVGIKAADAKEGTATACIQVPDCEQGCVPECPKCEICQGSVCGPDPSAPVPCCVVDLDCGKCETCDPVTNTCNKDVPGCCTNDTQCPNKCEVCDLGSNTCVLAQPGCCVDNLDCGKCETCEPTPDPNINKCQKTVPGCCTSDLQCPNKCEVCDTVPGSPTENTCVKSGPPCCASDVQCPNKCEVCDTVPASPTENTCVKSGPPCCRDDSQCPAKCEFCNTTTNLCEPKLGCCLVNGDCGKCETCEP